MRKLIWTALTALFLLILGYSASAAMPPVRYDPLPSVSWPSLYIVPLLFYSWLFSTIITFAGLFFIARYKKISFDSKRNNLFVFLFLSAFVALVGFVSTMILGSFLSAFEVNIVLLLGIKIPPNMGEIAGWVLWLIPFCLSSFLVFFFIIFVLLKEFFKVLKPRRYSILLAVIQAISVAISAVLSPMPTTL